LSTYISETRQLNIMQPYNRKPPPPKKFFCDFWMIPCSRCPPGDLTAIITLQAESRFICRESTGPVHLPP
ncbi:hypothetical protein NPIL_459801, partial [Nephila pilipes]